MTSLGTLELQLTANQAALYQQLDNIRAYATIVARDIERQLSKAFAGAGQSAGKTFADRFKNGVEPIKGILDNIFSGVFIGAGIGVFNSITGVINSALGAVQQLAGGIFNVTKDFQGFEASLKTFLKGNQQEIDKFVSSLEKFAATTPFELQELQKAAIQNLATGSKPDQLIKDLKTIGDVAAGANARLGDLMEVYAKSRSEGRLQNVDIDQFTGRGVQLRGELARMLGAKESEIRQLATDGKLEFRHLEEALRRMSAEGGVYFGAMENKAKTLEGRLSNIQDTFYQFQKSIGLAFEPIMNFALQTFGDIVSGLTSSNSVMKDVRKESEKLVTILKANPQLIESLNKAVQELVAGGFKLLLDGITSFTKYLETNPNIIKDISAAFDNTWEAVKTVFNALKNINIVIEGIAKVANVVWDIWLSWIKVLDNLYGIIFSLGEILVDNVLWAWKEIGKAVNKLVELVQLLFDGITNLVANPINALNAGLQNAVSITQNIGKNIGGWASNIGNAAQSAVKFAQNGISGIGVAFESVTKKAEDFWGWASGQKFSEKAENFWKLLSGQNPNSGNGTVGNIVQGVQGFLGGSSTINQRKYKIVESVGSGTENVAQYSDLETHHPSVVKRGGHKDRPYGMVEGRKEELNPLNTSLIKKDFILIDPQGKQYGVPVPSPVTGYAGKVGQGWGAVNLYADKEMTKLIAQVGHMINLQVKNGELVQYGQTLGGQAGMGKKGANTFGTHVDMSADPETYKRYIRDLQAGVFKETGQTPVRQGFNAAKQFFTPAQNALSKTPQGNDFISQLVAMSDRLNINPEDLLKVMMFETGGTLSPKKHPGSKLSATGLIGFTRDNEKELGISLENLAKLSQTEQLKYVEKYLKIHSRGKALDTYQKVVSTVFHGNPDGSLNVGDGFITLGGYMKKAESRYGDTARKLVADARNRSTSQPTQTTQQSPVSQESGGKEQAPGSPSGGNADDQRALAASRRKLAESKYKEIEAEITAATQRVDNAEKQQRKLDDERREMLDKRIRAEFAAREAKAQSDTAKKIIQEELRIYEINNKYAEASIKKNRELNDLLDARSTRLKILEEARKRGETVSPSDAGVDYTKAIEQLKEIIESDKQIREMELETNNLNTSNTIKELEKNKERQREINKLSRAHETYINQLRLEQSLADDGTKQNIQSKIDKAQIEHQTKIALMEKQNQLDDLQDQKVDLLGRGGLKADSDQVRQLQKDIDELVATIHAIMDKGDIDLKIFENQSKQAEEQNKRLKETGIVNREVGTLSAQARSIRARGGDEYQASALEAEAATMQEQLRYKQELLQIDQQITAARGTANEYTKEEIATLKANAEAINKINLESISQQVRTLGKDLEDVGKNALGSFFGDIISGSKSAGDAFKDLIGNIAQQLTGLAVKSLISNIFGGGKDKGGGGFLGGILGFSKGYIPNYAAGNLNPISEALNRERVQSGGRKPILGVFNEDEMILTAEQSKRFLELRLDKVLNFANGAVVGGGQNLGAEIGSKNTTINIPVTVNGAPESSVDIPQLQDSVRSVVLAEIQKQKRPGGALNK